MGLAIALALTHGLQPPRNELEGRERQRRRRRRAHQVRQAALVEARDALLRIHLSGHTACIVTLISLRLAQSHVNEVYLCYHFGSASTGTNR